MKKFLASLSLALSISYAVETAGKIIFKDTVYGMGIGTTFSLAAYLIDSSDFQKKLGIGLLVGGSLGLVYGVFIDSKPFVAYKKKVGNTKFYAYIDYLSLNPNLNIKFIWK